MSEVDILVPVAILAILRGDETVRGIADRLGVTEAQVEEWKDVFVVAGTLALRELGGRRRAHVPPGDEQIADEFGFGIFLTTHGRPTTRKHH